MPNLTAMLLADDAAKDGVEKEWSDEARAAAIAARQANARGGEGDASY